MMVDRGQLPPESIEDSPLSHVLWNAIGGREGSELKPDVIKCQLKAGDKVLLCTDGLSRHMTNTSIQNTLGRDTDLQQQCDELVAAANLGGGSDNITVVLASIETADPQSHSVLREASQNAELTTTHPLADTDEYLPLS
jgi:protein phosphatase